MDSTDGVQTFFYYKITLFNTLIYIIDFRNSKSGFPGKSQSEVQRFFNTCTLTLICIMKFDSYP